MRAFLWNLVERQNWNLRLSRLEQTHYQAALYADSAEGVLRGVDRIRGVIEDAFFCDV